MKRIINLISRIDYNPKIIAGLLITGIIGYNLATFDYIEFKRQATLNQAKADVESLSGSIEESKKDLRDKLKALDKTLYCIKQNSNTGVLVDCNTLKTREVIIETKAGNAVTPSEIIDKKLTPLEEEKKIEEVKKENFVSWRFNSQWDSKSKNDLHWDSFDEISLAHRIPVEYWYNAEKKYKVKKEVALCIARADSWLWKYLKTKNNFWNVWNNDRWDKVHFETAEKWVEAIFKVLNGKYLKHKQSIWSLSPGGWGNSPLYATSKENWFINTTNCLGVITWIQVWANYKIRL